MRKKPHIRWWDVFTQGGDLITEIEADSADHAMQKVAHAYGGGSGVYLTIGARHWREKAA